MITLSIGLLSVSLKLTPNTELPRIRAEIGGVEYTAQGSVVGTGASYEPKHIWNIEAIITKADALILKAIYAEHDRRRRALIDANVRINDSSELYVEPAPRTRDFATGAPTETTIIENGSNDLIVYYAAFYGWFIAEPRISRPYSNPFNNNDKQIVNFTLTETDKVEALP